MNEHEKYVDLCVRILANCRNELYRYFPYLDGAFASLEYSPDEEILIGTDGEKLYFQPQFLIKKYHENPAEIKRGYLHILMHCLYLHLWPVNVNRDERLWDLACDIAVEQMMAQELEQWIDKNEVKQICLEKLKEINGYQTSISAEQIYGMLFHNKFHNNELPYSTVEMEDAFNFDDHSVWKNLIQDGKEIQDRKARASSLRKKWEHIASYTAQNKQNGQNKRGTQAGEDQETLETLQRGRYDYRRFLKKFAIPREEVELDTESFDYIFYHYGLEHYGNLPLIEPLEYKEVNRLEELVIAIDTSGSCSKEMVQQFLDETYRIFSEKENFFRKMKVHILQCDCHLQDVAVIHSEEEWKEYSKNVVIQGRAGTNFRPVFRYVEEQRAKKEIKNLKALIYFTDGDGVFPEKTDYETAFVFVKKSEYMDKIPPWITKLLIYK